MAYTGSKSQSGRRTSIAIGDGVTPTEGFTPIFEMKSSTQSGRNNPTDDTTNFDSSGREFVTTIPDFGSFEFTGARVSSDPGQMALEAAWSAATVHNFKITYPKRADQTTTGDVAAFKALVTDANESNSFDKQISVTYKIKVTGAITLTPGT